MPQLPIVQKRYFVDRRLCELRNVNNPHDKIEFGWLPGLEEALPQFEEPTAAGRVLPAAGRVLPAAGRVLPALKALTDFCREHIHGTFQVVQAATAAINEAEAAPQVDYNGKLAENAVAISDSFHTDERYEAYYEVQKHRYAHGFPEIWKDLADAARAFTDYEVAAGIEWGIAPTAEWIDAIDAYVELLYQNDSVLGLPHDKLMQLAAEACKPR